MATPEELEWQAKSIGEQIKATAPEDVGFAIVFWNRRRSEGTPVAFASNAVTDQDRRETVKILQDFGSKLKPSQIILPS